MGFSGNASRPLGFEAIRIAVHVQMDALLARKPRYGHRFPAPYMICRT